MNLTREQAIAEHRKMWNWIADAIERTERVFNIDMLKDLYLGVFKEMKTYPVESCFLCEYSRSEKNKRCQGTTCDYCPVTGACDDGCLGGLYYSVSRAETWQNQSALARQIANLPEREDA